MTGTASLPQPDELYGNVFDACQDKANLPLSKMVVLGTLAGIYIGLGGLFATVALAGAEGIAFGAGQVLAGVVFSLGLALVLIAGAELFTGNTLMLGPVAAKRIPLMRAITALSVVYVANFAGAILLAGVAAVSGLHEAGDGAVGRAAMDLAETKTAKTFATTVASGVLANLLVCLAVWLAYAAQSVAGKIIGLVLPVTAFVAAGLEHSIANMYLLSYAYLAQGLIDQGATLLSLGESLANLLPATIGNILGGAFVALAYHAAYGKSAPA